MKLVLAEMSIYFQCIWWPTKTREFQRAKPTQSYAKIAKGKRSKGEEGKKWKNHFDKLAMLHDLQLELEVF